MAAADGTPFDNLPTSKRMHLASPPQETATGG